MRTFLSAIVVFLLLPALSAQASASESSMCQELSSHAPAAQLLERERLEERNLDVIAVETGADTPWCQSADDPRCSQRDPGAEASSSSVTVPPLPYAARIEPALSEALHIAPQLGDIVRSDGFGARVERPPQP